MSVPSETRESEVLEQLKNEYCPAVEESLVILIYAENTVKDAHTLLSQLRDAAVIEQASLSEEELNRVGSISPSIGTSSSAWGFENLSLTNGSTSSSASSQFSGPPPTWDVAGDKRSNLDELRDMFPELSEVNVQMMYKKYDGDFERVVDELLNLQFLDAEGEVPKGIDGFAVENIPSGAKGKAARKKARRGSKQSDKLTLTAHYVRPDVSGEIPPSPSLSKRDTNALPTPRSISIQTAPQPAQKPVEDPNAWQCVSPTKTRHVRSISQSPAVAAGHATHYHRLANESFNKARAAHRKANGTNMMGAVAGYYAETGQTYNAVAHNFSESAQRALVDQNTFRHGKGDRYLLDLHGATGKVAQAIVRERLAGWWGNGGGDGSERRPFEIICGVGNNSHDGRAVLLPEISKMLVKDRWHFRAERGKIVVTSPKEAVGKRVLAPR